MLTLQTPPTVVGDEKNKVLQKIVSRKTQQKFPEFDSLNED